MLKAHVPGRIAETTGNKFHALFEIGWSLNVC